MQRLSKFKLFLAIICTAVALICALPNFKHVDNTWLPNTTVNLGLDLRGGSHLLLDVDFDSYMNDLLESMADSLRKVFRENKIGYKNLIVGNSNIIFNLRDL